MKLNSKTGIGLAVAIACIGLAAAPADASFYLGDFVYCDLGADGHFDAGTDFPLDGVVVEVTCVDSLGLTCVDTLAATGGFPVLTDVPARLDKFVENCGPPNGEPQVDYVPDATSLLPSGRYLVELSACWVAGAPRPWTCTVRVDPMTLPLECNGLVTPMVGGFPVEADGDGKLCTLGVDGPFPEDQVLGNIAAQGGCFDHADPLPGSGMFTAIFENLMVGGPAQDRCALYNDFGYTPEDMGDGCTPGYWRNHLDEWAATGLSPGDDFDTTFGVDYFDPDITLDDAINLGGGGIRKVARHGTAALLNALHPEVDYPFSAAEVIAAVQAQDVDALAEANELSDTCPTEY
jgi:hypothetical protein